MLTAQIKFPTNPSEILPKVIMPHGFIGFEEYQHYTMTPFFEDQPHNAFWLLKSLDHPDLSFVLVSIDSLQIPGVHIVQEDIEGCCQNLGIKIDEIYVFLVVTFVRQADNQVSMTVNTRAPWIYHTITRQGWQVVLSNSDYPIALKIK